MEINQAAPKFQDVSIAPMHTVEHILNATMVKTFGCPRSRNAHIEKKKSKCDYELASCPNKEQIQAIEEKVNEVIRLHLPVSIECHNRKPKILSTSANCRKTQVKHYGSSASEAMMSVHVSDYM